MFSSVIYITKYKDDEYTDSTEKVRYILGWRFWDRANTQSDENKLAEVYQVLLAKGIVTIRYFSMFLAKVRGKRATLPSAPSNNLRIRPKVYKARDIRKAWATENSGRAYGQPS